MNFATQARLRRRARTSRLGLALAMSSLPLFVAVPGAEAKSPGAKYCFHGVCHRVMTLAETRAAVGKVVHAVTSFYDDCRRDPYNPCGLTSSGEPFRPGETNNAASPLYPDGTVILVRNPRNGQSAIVRINNAGPYWGNRTLDLSRGAGHKLGLGGVGVARVEVTVLRAPSEKEARYQRNRRYAPMPGHVGTFATLDAARTHAVAALDLPAGTSGGEIAVAHADMTAMPVTPVTYHPIAGAKPDTRRLPVEVVRVSSAAPSEVQIEPIAVSVADEISGASLLVRRAGETTRVIANLDDAAERRLRLAKSARVEDLALDGAPTLATRSEASWYRNQKVQVAHVALLKPAGVDASEAGLALFAALNKMKQAQRGDVEPAHIACIAPAIDDRCGGPRRSPGRARGNDLYAMAA